MACRDTCKYYKSCMRKKNLEARVCGTCKHEKKDITEEPCLNCDIRMRNDKWEAKDG